MQLVESLTRIHETETDQELVECKAYVCTVPACELAQREDRCTASYVASQLSLLPVLATELRLEPCALPTFGTTTFGFGFALGLGPDPDL